jgi:hypothetical protein
MPIDKNLITKLQETLDDQRITFVDEFSIRTFSRPSSEEAAFFITVSKDKTKSDLEAFLLLLERLEFAEQEWSWDKQHFEEISIHDLHHVLHYLVKNGEFLAIDGEAALRRIQVHADDFDVGSVVTIDSANVLLFDDWNLMQLFGYNQNNYYLYLWYTTA